MVKSFDDLTFVDDFMFCTVMEDPALCKELLTMLLKDKGGDYNDLPDTFIIFLCTFDYLQEGLPVYTIRPSCAGNGIYQAARKAGK